MKRISVLMIATMALLFTACDNNNENDKNQFDVNPENLKGSIPSGDNITFEASVTYKLTGALVVMEGATLTIPAGTVIIATEVNDANPNVRYIAVERGAKLNVNGTSDKPVVMTCAKKESSSWGGLVICGYAPHNKSNGEAFAEVSDLAYGGNKPADCSGSITHLRVEYTGYKYSDTKEFNGVSLFGVGSGTVFENVTSYKGGDDGIEFFGGTVNAKNLLSIDSEDDGFDFADGWGGTATNVYVRNSSKSSIEGSNNGDQGDATPLTNATLKNLTLIGSGEKPFYFKEGGGKQNVDNVVIGGGKTGKQPYFFADPIEKDAHVYTRLVAGDLKVTNVLFIDTNVPKVWDERLVITENANATGAGNGTGRPSWVSEAMNTTSNGSKIF